MFPTFCIIAAVVATLIPSEQSKAQPQRAKWEYKEVESRVNLSGFSFGRVNETELKKRVEAMKKLGEEGWECIGIVYVGDQDGSYRIFYRQSSDPAARKKWEYSLAVSCFGPMPLFGPPPPSDVNQLRKLGEDGWELAWTTQVLASPNNKSVFVLKRAR